MLSISQALNHWLENTYLVFNSFTSHNNINFVILPLQMGKIRLRKIKVYA